MRPYVEHYRRKYPIRVTVMNYMDRYKSGSMPGVDKINPPASWVERRGTRVFAFDTEEQLSAFKQTYGVQ